MSRVSSERGSVCAGGVMVKLSGFCGCVHEASSRCSGIARFCLSSQCLVTIDMTSCEVVCSSFLLRFVRTVTLDWSQALGFIPAFIFRLLWQCFVAFVVALVFLVSKFVR